MGTMRNKCEFKKGCGGMRSRLLALCLILGGVVSVTTGCSEPVEDEAAVVMIDHSGGSSQFVLTEAAVSDVVKTENIQCTFRQTQSETINFPVSGKMVAEVCVEIGDTVEKGQLLAVLDGADCEDEIRDLEYQIARNRLQLEYVDINEANALSSRWWRYTYQSSGSDAETEKLEADLESLKQTYRYQREDYQDEIELELVQLEAYQKELEEGRIYASIDGVVRKMAANMDSRISSEEDMAFMIIDETSCLFECSRVEYAGFFSEGEIFDLLVKGGKETITYRVTPWKKDEWDKKIYFALVNEGDAEAINIGTAGTMTLVLDSRESVLAVPTGAVYTLDGKACVYVLGENEIREPRWVETGLYGDTLVEIVSGLEEGEAVILR